jgi:hypothetical protein
MAMTACVDPAVVNELESIPFCGVHPTVGGGFQNAEAKAAIPIGVPGQGC